MQNDGKKQAAIFLDRDGTINEEVGYLDQPEKLRMIPGAARAIRLINKSGLKAIVVTNQSGVARGFFDEAMVAAIHEKMQKFLEAKGAWIDRFYYCPHHPTDGMGSYLQECSCRKPAPGMLLRAAEELALSLNDSYIIGDTLKDIEAGGRAGVPGVLVQTGYGAESAAALAGFDREKAGVYHPVYVATTLEEAVRWIIADQGREKR
ncbi:MAG: HAD family hydrolase [Syntrophales bacterium]|jgi:D,D-heptose 1,7-bisphosphate phosphatase|nr:HAD family hydrolase [Syntrophales bacterium]